MKALHSITPPIAQEYIEAANTLLNMYLSDGSDMQFFVMPDEPERIGFWCDSWNEDQTFRKAIHDSWAREELRWLAHGSNVRYHEPMHPGIENLFVEYNP